MIPADLLPFALIILAAILVFWQLLRTFVELCELDLMLGPASWLVAVIAAQVIVVKTGLDIGLTWIRIGS